MSIRWMKGVRKEKFSHDLGRLIRRLRFDIVPLGNKESRPSSFRTANEFYSGGTGTGDGGSSCKLRDNTGVQTVGGDRSTIDEKNDQYTDALIMAGSIHSEFQV